METNSTTPNTKPQPVVIYGAVIAGVTAIVGGLTAIFSDNPTVVLVLGIVSVVIGGVNVAKDQIVKGLVVPVKDTVAYVNDQRQVITGPAAPGADGQVVQNVVTDGGAPGF